MSNRPISFSSPSDDDQPKRQRSKISEGFLLVLRALLFLVQFVVYALGFLFYHLGRGLIALSRLRDDPPNDQPPSKPPLSSPNHPPNR